MDEEELARVFEPFARGSAAGRSSAGGTGLGLTISKMLVGLMGGELTARSRPGEGSTFSVRLFLPEIAADATAPLPASRTGYAGPRRRILVVDNEEADRTLMHDLLQPLGFVIESAASGEEALARLTDAQAPCPDAIFMDLAMPGLDGWETIRRLRAAGLGRVPLAVVSANAFDRGLDNEVGVAAADFLVKPVRLSRLLDWLGDRLELSWNPVATAPAAPAPGPETLPDADQLRALNELVGLGYMRGVQRKLDEIEAADAAARGFVSRLRGLAQRFELDALQDAVGKALHEQGRS
jgi:CheY-like chemotaxis protein